MELTKRPKVKYFIGSNKMKLKIINEFLTQHEFSDVKSIDRDDIGIMLLYEE